MRTSRVSRESARLTTALPPRRTTPRTSRAIKVEDIEDALSPQTPISLKRKRETTVKTIKEEETISTRISPRRLGQSPDTKPQKARRQPAKRIKREDGEVVVEPPANWEEMYNTTKEMRALVIAPVDTMGCESLAEEHRSPQDQRFQTLVSLMLSSQTKDTVTAAAIKNLQENLEGGLTVAAVLEVAPTRLNELIEKVGFHNNKTKFIKATAEILRDQFDGDIPDTIEGMISLPGVGPKMAYLCMSAAWGRDEGIGVDVHVHRITNLWGWHKTNTPEETRAALESWLPREKWHDINHLLVGFGQTWCPPVGRRCGECRLSSGLCPSAVVGKTVKQRMKKEIVSVKGEDAESPLKQRIEVKTEIGDIKAEDL